MQTIKERLDSGALVYVENTKGERVASCFREDPVYVLVGATGKHMLNIDDTPSERLEAHWEGFSKACVDHSDSAPAKAAEPIASDNVVTIADTFIERWNNQTKTISVPWLAKSLDVGVKVASLNLSGYPLSGRRYTFSDGSAIIARGRGRSHQVRKE